MTIFWIHSHDVICGLCWQIALLFIYVDSKMAAVTGWVWLPLGVNVHVHGQLWANLFVCLHGFQDGGRDRMRMTAFRRECTCTWPAMGEFVCLFTWIPRWRPWQDEDDCL
jgi:hypothetical protein